MRPADAEPTDIGQAAFPARRSPVRPAALQRPRPSCEMPMGRYLCLFVADSQPCSILFIFICRTADTDALISPLSRIPQFRGHETNQHRWPTPVAILCNMHNE